MRCLLYISCFLQVSCYSFKGITIPPEIKSYYVEDFTNNTLNAPPEIDQLFSEALRKIIREQSRLTYTETDPDITFSGSIVGFRVVAVAPVEGNTTALNRLEVSVQINYRNIRDSEEDWDKRYSDFEDFSTDVDLSSVQDELVADIVADIAERVFNDSFTNW